MSETKELDIQRSGNYQVFMFAFVRYAGFIYLSSHIVVMILTLLLFLN